MAALAKVPNICKRCKSPFNAVYAARKYCSYKCARAKSWKPYGLYMDRGYVVVSRAVYKTEGYCPSNCSLHSWFPWRRAHILKAEHALGRPLKSHEAVHHLDMNPRNNKSQNLLVCGVGYHNWIHSEMARRYAKEHFGDLQQNVG